MARRRKKLGDILVAWQMIKQEDLNKAVEYAQKNGKRLGAALVELQILGEEEVTKALAAQFETETTPYLSLVHPMWKTHYGDYDHLARVKEWSLAGGVEEDLPFS